MSPVWRLLARQSTSVRRLNSDYRSSSWDHDICLGWKVTTLGSVADRSFEFVEV